jgi:hypothetical protein
MEYVKNRNRYTSQKKFTHFATKSSEIIIASRKEVLLNKKQKTKSKSKKKSIFFCFFDFVDDARPTSFSDPKREVYNLKGSFKNRADKILIWTAINSRKTAE